MDDEIHSRAGGGKRPLARLKRFSIAQLLTFLAVSFVMGPLFFSNYWGYRQSRRYLTDAAFTNIRNVAALEASETLEVVRSAETLVPSIVRGNQHLFSTMRAWAAVQHQHGRTILSNVLREHLSAKAEESSSVDEFYVLSQTGELAGSSDETRLFGADLSASHCFVRGREASGILGFDFKHVSRRGKRASAMTGGPGDESEVPPLEARLLISSPIHDSGNNFLGVFCGTFNLDIHRRLLSAHRYRTNLATLYLLDAQERIVTGSFDDPMKAPIGRLYSSLERPALSRRVASEQRFRSFSGEEVLIAYVPIPIFEWAIVVEVPVSTALADLERLKWQAVGGSLALAGVLLGCVVLVWRTVVLPLRALSEASETMVSGATGETVEPGGPIELVELARAFNRMSLGLKDSADHLEARIAERTRELRESQAFLELLLDSIDRRVIVVDRNLRIVKANLAAQRMHGSALVGRSCCEALEGAVEPLDDCPVRRTFETFESIAQERSQRTVRGIEPVYVETFPVFDAQGGVESVVEIGHVVTAEMQIQHHIVHQEKMAAFGQLAAGVAHEIGNPIASIQSQLQLAQGEPECAEETLEVVKQQVARMDRILRQLVEFTRKRKDEIVLASANEIVQDVGRLVVHHPKARGVSVTFALCEDLPAVRVNEDHLVQVLLNLALNALDAIEGVGSLVFETVVESGTVAIRVRDSGCGIAEENRARVFEPFFSSKTEGQGTGLGLFVSKGIMEKMGGALELEKTDETGTIFVARVVAVD